MPTFQLQCCSLLQDTSADEDKEETKRALKIHIKEHKAATRRGETEKSASLVPRPSPAPVFDRLQYAKTEPEGLVNLTT